MEDAPLPLRVDFIDNIFEDLGAFFACPENDEIILAYGGKIDEWLQEEADIPPNVFYFTTFYNKKIHTYTPANILKVKREVLITSLIKYQASQNRLCPSNNYDSLFVDDFQAFRGMSDMDLKKVVLCSREDFHVDEKNNQKLRTLWRSLIVPNSYAYGIWDTDHGLIGATPELLFEVAGNKLETFALAGTAKKENADQLMRSEKDRLEHQFVVDDIFEKISELNYSPSVGETGLASYGRMVHLKTPLSVQHVGNLNLSLIISKLSPTAALSGYPSALSLETLSQNSYGRKFPDRLFGGCFGFSGPEQKCVVMIRNIQWKENLFFIETGAGIIHSSVLEKELSEIQFKRQVVRELLV
jgi:menaquinone-specific isochorismate synthase